ncbi:Heterogeneous nuclear ribonucleoprotein like, partial [Actinidia chinensis var. chinensis]
MPPKTPSAAGPRRTTTRTTARKSNPIPASRKADTTITTASPERVPSSTTTEFSPKTTSKSHVYEVPATTTPQTTPLASLIIETACKTRSEHVNETNPRNREEIRDPIAQNENLDVSASEIKADVPDNVGGVGQESGFKTVGDVETKKGVRTVVKRTVRVVKKVVKKKVPKKVQRGQAVSLSEESGKVDNEKGNPNASVLGEAEVENLNSVESDSLENLEPGPPASVSVGVENPNSYVDVSMEAEKLDSDPSSSNPLTVENPEEIEAEEAERKDSGNENLSEAPVSDVVIDPKNASNEGEQAVSGTETQLGDQNVGLITNQNDEIETENVDSGGGDLGGAKEEVVSFDVGDWKGEVGMRDGVVWSGEMEALERRKRRKTEIFVGGLHKDAKEEDIRKVFQEVGEIVEVRLVMSDKIGKNKGFAFVRYASAADAKNALAKFSSVEVCGKQCGARPAEGNDTIFLGNIDKKWKSEDIVKLLQEIGIEKIDKVTVNADPSNIECNRGFAYLELETIRDAQNAYRKLQKKDIFGKHQKIKVAWAEPLSEPDEEEMLKVKSVYAEYLPSSWDEEKVKDYFKKFGEIENVVLAKDLPSSRRKDFAFVNYTSREAALACIEALSCDSLTDEDSKVNVKVSLAKPLSKGKQVKHVTNPVSKEPPKAKMKAPQPVLKPHQPRNMGKTSSSSNRYVNVGVDRGSSTTSELVQLLRRQASMRQPQTGLVTGSVDRDYHYPSPVRKRPLSLLRDDPIYSDPRGYPRARIESSLPAASPSGLYQGIGMTSLPHNHRPGADYASRSLNGAEYYSNSLQPRGGPPYYGSSGTYHR